MARDVFYSLHLAPFFMSHCRESSTSPGQTPANKVHIITHCPLMLPDVQADANWWKPQSFGSGPGAAPRGALCSKQPWSDGLAWLLLAPELVGHCNVPFAGRDSLPGRLQKPSSSTSGIGG